MKSRLKNGTPKKIKFLINRITNKKRSAAAGAFLHVKKDFFPLLFLFRILIGHEKTASLYGDSGSD